MLQYILAHAGEALVYIRVRVSQHGYSARAQERVAGLVIADTVGFVVLRAVKLYRYAAAVAVKIQDVAAEHLLPPEVLRPRAQKVVPQAALLVGHAAAQPPRAFFHGLVGRCGHGDHPFWWLCGGLDSAVSFT